MLIVAALMAATLMVAALMVAMAAHLQWSKRWCVSYCEAYHMQCYLKHDHRDHSLEEREEREEKTRVKAMQTRYVYIRYVYMYDVWYLYEQAFEGRKKPCVFRVPLSLLHEALSHSLFSRSWWY